MAGRIYDEKPDFAKRALPRNWTARYRQGPLAQMTRAVAFLAPLLRCRSTYSLSPAPALSSAGKCPVALSCFSEGKPSGDLAWSWGGGDATANPGARGRVSQPRGAGVGKGRAAVPRGSLTRVAHRGVQQVHARSGQTQPIDCVRRLLKIRHHAKVVWRRKVGPNPGDPAGRSRFARDGQIQSPGGWVWSGGAKAKQTNKQRC